jgi:nucleoside-diphosphate-sugar epimerase
MDGLCCAFQGVGSVINTAAVIATMFHTVNSIYMKNRTGSTNILNTAKRAGVKNLVHLAGFPMKEKANELGDTFHLTWLA